MQSYQENKENQMYDSRRTYKMYKNNNPETKKISAPKKASKNETRRIIFVSEDYEKSEAFELYEESVMRIPGSLRSQIKTKTLDDDVETDEELIEKQQTIIIENLLEEIQFRKQKKLEFSEYF